MGTLEDFWELGDKAYESIDVKGYLKVPFSKGQILRSTPNTAPLICGAYNTQPEGLLTTA